MVEIQMSFSSMFQNPSVFIVCWHVVVTLLTMDLS